MAIKIGSNHANAYNNLANSKFALADRGGACVDWNKAASLGIETTAQWLQSESGAWCGYSQ